jgi:hypothetical protein
MSTNTDVSQAAVTSHERVPVKITSKITAGAQYEMELEELGSEQERTWPCSTMKRLTRIQRRWMW